MTAHNQQLGRFGEDAAASWYLNHGYEVVARNWRVREGELDLICRPVDPAGSDSSLIVFVEVKTRSSKRFGGGYLAVDWRKQKKLRQLALIWLSTVEEYYAEMRFDVVDVDRHGHVQIWEEAF